jgi:hypothetical protein
MNKHYSIKPPSKIAASANNPNDMHTSSEKSMSKYP